MKKRILALMIIGTVILTAACGKPAKDAAAEAAPTPEPRKTVEAFGTVEANEIENVSLDIEAKVETMNVKEGQQVKKGDILLSIDNKQYMERIKSKQHDLSIIRLEAEKLKSESSNPDIQKLTNDLSYAEEQLRKAGKELEAKEKLHNSGAISQYEYDEFVKSVDSKRKSAEDIRYNLNSIMHNNEISLAIQNEKATAMEGEISQMKAAVNKSYISENDIICSVENGIVCEIGYKAGDVINSENKILSVLDLDSLVIKADVAEEFIKDVKMSARVDIIPVADKSRQYNGKVISMAKNAVDKNGETVIPVEISIDNKDSFLLPNFNVDVKIYME
ncbi:MAG TPA: efflux RND transporter periplasmic adaptor subunit [Clostridia bacterium]|nr:efflux RND transporter periplasmic adaptor subunit [Clostridia bacterium]